MWGCEALRECGVWGCWRSLGESNPCFQIESLAS